MTIEESKDELYRLLSDCVNGGYPIRNNTQRGRYRKAVEMAIKALEQIKKIKNIINGPVCMQGYVPKYMDICEVLEGGEEV